MRLLSLFLLFFSIVSPLDAADNCSSIELTVPTKLTSLLKPGSVHEYYFKSPGEGTMSVTLSDDSGVNAVKSSISDDSCPGSVDGVLTWSQKVVTGDDFNLHLYDSLSDEASYYYELNIVFTPLATGWQESVGTGRPTNSAIKMDIDADFNLIYGGAGHSMFGDIGATGDSILYVNDPDNDAYAGALYESDANYMDKDFTFNASTYTGGDSRKANSSTASLELPDHVEGRHIAWAGLFWQGYIMNDLGAGMSTDDVDKDIEGWNSLTMKTPDGVMHQLSASPEIKDNAQSTYYYASKDDNSYRYFYSAYVDVTTLVKNSYSPKDDLFAVGNILTTAGEDYGDNMYFSHIGTGQWYDNVKMGHFGGWSLVVAYSLDDVTVTANDVDLKNISVYNGYDLFVTWGDGRVPFEKEVSLSGFITPKQHPINSRLLFFGGGVDQGIFDDSLKLRDGKTTDFIDLSNSINTAGRQFNSSYSDLGVQMDPAKPYRQGMDLDIYDVSDLMEIDQSETKVKFGVIKDGVTCDQVFPQVLAFSTELYKPKFCYDYAYSQHSRYFTEENNGTVPPSLKGLVTRGDDIRLSLYVRSDEDSDIIAKNLRMNITDINTTQATYVPNSVSITFPAEVNATFIPDGTDGLSTSDSDILNIPFGDMNGTQSIYSYYSLSPKVDKLDMPINANVSYDLTFLGADGDPFDISYTSVLGDYDFPLCTGANFLYEPEWSVFNVVQSDIYDSASGAQYYNIPTQVTRRPGRFDVVSYYAMDMDTERPINTMVGVELIDAGAFHDINASCLEPSSAISPRVWVFFEGNVTSTPFDRAAIQNAIDNGHVSDQIYAPGSPDNLKVAEDFYKEARENTAFRMIYNALPDVNGTLVDIELGNKDGTVRIVNFSDLTTVHPKCKQLVKNPSNDTMTDRTAVACGNAGNNSTYTDLAICMECMFGINSQVICSRDNFATRPESYHITLSDLSKDANATTPVSFATDRTGVASPTVGKVDLASGYPYRFTMSATNHYSNAASPGYQHALTNTLDDNASFIWSPSDPTAAIANCNDLSDVPQTVSFLAGTAAVDLNVTQVGEYLYKLIDSTWTRVDSDPASMTHHDNAYFYGYASGKNGAPAKDCAEGQSSVPAFGATPATGTHNGYAALTNVSGCEIRSDHTNSDAGLVYKDYDLTFHPYTFDLSDINVSFGVGDRQDFANGWLYMNDLVDDADQSFHLRGNITAISADGMLLSNFVGGCYAQDIRLSLGNDVPTASYPDVPEQIYRLLDTNGTDTLADENGTLTNTGTLLTLTDGNFSKGMAGMTTIDLNINFSREVNNSVNPLTVTYGDFGTACDNPTACQMQADLLSAHVAGATLTIDQTLPYYYGRVHAPRYRIIDNIGTIGLYYEIYCDPSNAVNPCLITDPSDHALTMPNRLLSIDDIRWHQNEAHTSDIEGVIGASLPPRGADDLTLHTRTAFDMASFSYDESKGYPYKTTITIPASPWLIYSKFDPTASVNFFELEFNSAGGYAGRNIGVSSADSNASRNTNRRIEW